MMPCPSNDGVHYEKGPPMHNIDPVVAERQIRKMFDHVASLTDLAKDVADMDFAAVEMRLMSYFAQAEAPKTARVGRRALVLRTTRVVTC